MFSCIVSVIGPGGRTSFSFHGVENLKPRNDDVKLRHSSAFFLHRLHERSTRVVIKMNSQKPVAANTFHSERSSNISVHELANITRNRRA
jgi:hypothetical protein